MESGTEYDNDGDLSTFSAQSMASNETVVSSPSFSDLDNSNIVSKKQKLLAQKQRKQIKKMEKKSEKKKLKNKISKEDYFSKQLEYRAWLEEVKKLNLDDLSPGKSKHYFKKFVKKWNKRQLPKHYYRGGNVWAAGSPSTQSLWAMPCANDLTPGSLPEEAMVKSHIREPDIEDSSFATFGKKAGRKALKELEKMRLLQLEKEAEQNFGGKRPIEHVYDEPMSPNLRRALAHDYDVPDIEIKSDKRGYDTPIYPRPLSTTLKDKENDTKHSICKFGKRNGKLLPVPAVLPTVSDLPSPPPPPPPPAIPDKVQAGPATLPSPPPPITSPENKTQTKSYNSHCSKEKVMRKPVKNEKKKPPPVPKRSKSTRPVSVHVMQASYIETPHNTTTGLPQLTPIMVRREKHLSACDLEHKVSEENVSQSGTTGRRRPLSGHYQSIISGQSRLRNSSSGSSVSSTASIGSLASLSSTRSDITASIKSFEVSTIRRTPSRKLGRKDSYCAQLESASYVVFEKLAAGRKSQMEKRAMTPEKKARLRSEYDVPRLPPVPITQTVVVCENGKQKTAVVKVTPGKSAKPINI